MPRAAQGVRIVPDSVAARIHADVPDLPG